MYPVDYTKYAHLRREHAKIMSKCKDGYPGHKCRLCGKHEHANWMKSCKNRLIRDQVCFTCDFWLERVQARLEHGINGQSVIMMWNGEQTALWIEPSDPDVPKRMKGFGGTMHTIKYRDGRIVKCDNLWYNGVVPERFKKVLTINAELVRNV